MLVIIDFLLQNFDIIFYSFLGGIVPALLWLWFWLRQDLHPEPKKILFQTFALGAATIPAVYIAESSLYELFLKFNLTSAGAYSPLFIFALAATEEFFKFTAAYYAALRRKFFDEPVDALIYMITAALGFSAVENAMYIYQAASNGSVILGMFSGNLRFLGASLTHVVSSGLIGASIAFSFFHKKHKSRNAFLGFLLAVLLHGLFNYFIIKTEENIFKVFFGIWVFAIIIIYIFEKLRKNKE